MPWQHVMKLWGIQMVFEVIVPELCIAMVSQKWARRGRFGDMTENLRKFFDVQVRHVPKSQAAHTCPAAPRHAFARAGR